MLRGPIRIRKLISGDEGRVRGQNKIIRVFLPATLSNLNKTRRSKKRSTFKRNKRNKRKHTSKDNREQI